MADNSSNKPNKNLSEISHLFLSSIRDRSNQPRPQRVPPGAKKAAKSENTSPKPAAKDKDALQLTEEEKALAAEISAANPQPIRTITAIIAAHLSDRQFAQTKRYARYLAAEGQRVGLIEVDADEFRLMTFEPGRSEEIQSEAKPCEFNTRAIGDAINELNNDVDCWLLLLSNPRLPEARQLLAASDRWTLLTTCDHDGIISSYRTLKGLADLHRPALSVAMLDARHLSQADGVYRKLAGVCSQFLQWTPEPGEAVIDTPGVAEHMIMWCKIDDQRPQPPMPHWKIVSDLLERAKAQSSSQGTKNMEEKIMADVAPIVEPVTRVAPKNFAKTSTMKESISEPVWEGPAMSSIEVPEPMISSPASFASGSMNTLSDFSIPNLNSSETVMPQAPALHRPLTPNTQMPAQMHMQRGNDDCEVVDLNVGPSGEIDLLGAIVQRLKMDLAECAIRPPMCPEARVAVSRERRLVLLAAESSGLSGLKAIASAYRWMNENRQLLSMALPQFAIDPNHVPQMRLFIDHADINADLLQPMMQSGAVSVQTYRKIRWGGRTGLLLDAA